MYLIMYSKVCKCIKINSHNLTKPQFLTFFYSLFFLFTFDTHFFVHLFIFNVNFLNKYKYKNLAVYKGRNVTAIFFANRKSQGEK